MAGRDDLVYDEDDYVPPGYVPPKRAGGRTRSLVALAVLGVIVGAFVVLFLLRSRERARYAERARSAQNAAFAANRIGAERAPIGPAPTPMGNWERMVGLWSRMPRPEERGQPIRFEIRWDQTATVTSLDEEGQRVSRDWRIVGYEERGDDITLEMRDLVGNPEKRLRFTFREDGSILLYDGMRGLEFRAER